MILFVKNLCSISSSSKWSQDVRINISIVFLKNSQLNSFQEEAKYRTVKLTEWNNKHWLELKIR